MINRIVGIAKETVWYFRHELETIFHDWGALLLFVIAMFIYPFIYSVAYKNEVVANIPVAVADLDHSRSSRQLARMLDATEQINIKYKASSLKEAEQMFFDGEVNGIILIPNDFEQKIFKGLQTNVAVYCDASYFLYYKQVYAGTVYATSTFGAGVEVKRSLGEGKFFKQAIEQQDPLKVQTFSLYNPEGGYGTLIMPGIILIIMQQTLLIGIGLLGGTIRRKNKYSCYLMQMEKPFGSIPVVLGKSTAYVFLYIFNALFTMYIIHNWFGFPDKGSFLQSLLLVVPFLYTVSFLGLSISMFFRERVHALMFMVFLSPIVLFFSGLSWPAQSIPVSLYNGIAKLFPSTTAVPAYIHLRIMGSGLRAIQGDAIFLLGQMVVYFIAACVIIKLKIKKLNPKLLQIQSH